MRGPFNRFFQALLRARELGALLMILFMFAIVGSITVVSSGGGRRLLLRRFPPIPPS